LIASLANGRTRLTNALFSDDSCYFAKALQALGFDVQLNESDREMTVNGLGGIIPSRKAELFIGNAGTAARFLSDVVKQDQLYREILVADRHGRVVAASMRSDFGVSIGGGQFELRIDRIDAIEGGGYAILDYKSGEPRSLRWNGEVVRDPQLLAYLMAERGRDVVALANVSLANGRAKFTGKTSHRGLLPGVSGLPGMNPNKVPAEQIAAAWQEETGRWLYGLQLVAADYIAGRAPVQPASDVCRNCHLTTLCRRVELATIDSPGGEDA
jgi:hypothetical protein